MQKTPRKKTSTKELSKAELIQKIKELEKTEKKLDEEINMLEMKGVKETIAGDIMNALHEYNEMKDVLGEIFSHYCQFIGTTTAQLHKMYNVPADS